MEDRKAVEHRLIEFLNEVRFYELPVNYAVKRLAVIPHSSVKDYFSSDEENDEDE
jgi:hypothetical protein